MPPHCGPGKTGEEDWAKWLSGHHFRSSERRHVSPPEPQNKHLQDGPRHLATSELPKVSCVVRKHRAGPDSSFIGNRILGIVIIILEELHAFPKAIQLDK